MARRNNNPEVSKTLFCSFCGKSQDEVAKLIAGPTVYICDECTELCDDIIWSDSGDKVSIRVKVPSSSAYDDLLQDVVGKILSEAFPSYDIQYEFRTPDKHRTDGSGSAVAVYSVAREVGNSEELTKQVSELAAKLSVMNEKFINESERAKKINQDLVDLKDEYLGILRETFKSIKEKDIDLRVVMFLDVSGFSKFSFDNKKAVVDMLRGITPPLLSDRGAHEINMWGDAIVATFTDANQAVSSAIKFLRHLSVEQLDARIGMAWGSIRMIYNPATGRRDIDGAVVDLAARLEPMANLGTILCTKEFSALQIDTETFELVPVTKEVTKDFAEYKAGDVMDLFEIKYLKN